MIEPLQRLGYVFWADNPKPNPMFFVKGMPPYGARWTHQVHITEPTGEKWLSLPFRDYVRAHPMEAQRYERLKRYLVATHRSDREAYTDGLCRGDSRQIGGKR